MSDRHAHGHELELGVGVRVSVALLVHGVEGAPQFRGVRPRVSRDRQLERLARVAEVEGRAHLGVIRAGELLTPARHEVRDLLGHRAGSEFRAG